MKILLGAGGMTAVILCLRQLLPFEIEGGLSGRLPAMAVYLGAGVLVYAAVMAAVGSDATRGVLRWLRNHRGRKL